MLARILLVLPLIAIGAALVLYFATRDRRYLRFIREALKFTVIVGLGVMLYFAVRRLGIQLP